MHPPWSFGIDHLLQTNRGLLPIALSSSSSTAHSSANILCLLPQQQALLTSHVDSFYPEDLSIALFLIPNRSAVSCYRPISVDLQRILPNGFIHYFLSIVRLALYICHKRSLPVGWAWFTSLHSLETNFLSIWWSGRSLYIYWAWFPRKRRQIDRPGRFSCRIPWLGFPRPTWASNIEVLNQYLTW